YSADSVAHAVVRLGDERPAVIAQSLDQPDLPEWLRPVQVLRQDPAGKVSQLLLSPWPRDGRMPKVIEDLEVRVVNPDRAPEPQRNEAHLLSIARDKVQLRDHQPDQVAVPGRRALEDGDRPHVHGVVLTLDPEERCIQRAQSIDRGAPRRRALTSSAS